MSKLRRKKLTMQNEVEHKNDDKQTLGYPRTMPRIFGRAIENAKKHKIKLAPGIQNMGHGNCSYESAILNINERDCFKEGFVMSADFYRRVWNTDLMNKILDERIPWNPGMTRSQIVEGFEELMESGVYERSYFGDMMMAGIACGTRKLILIFNTHELTPHDPISVIDPADYGGTKDTDIPVVLAYDLVHYESLHPVDSEDIEGTIKLAKSYISKPSTYRQDYGFTRQDIKYLVSPSIAKEMSRNADDREGKLETINLNTSMDVPKNNKEETECFRFEGICFRELYNGNMICGICQVECTKLVVHMNESTKCSEIFPMVKFKSEYSKYRHILSQKKRRKEEIICGFKLPDESLPKNCLNLEKQGTGPKKNDIKSCQTAKNESSNANKEKDKDGFDFGGVCFKVLVNGKVKCGLCQMEISRLIVHMNGSPECTKDFDMGDFRTEYSNYRHRQRQKKMASKQQSIDPKGFRENVNKRKKNQEEKQKAEDPKGFRNNLNARVRKHEEQQKNIDPKGFRENVNKRKKIQEEKKKAEDPKSFRDNLNARVRKHEEQQKNVDPKGFRENVNKRKKIHEEKKKAEDPEGFRENVNKRKKIQEEKKKIEDPKSFRDNLNARVRKHEEKQKNVDPKGFRENVNKRKKNQENRYKVADPKDFRDKLNKRVRKHTEKQRNADPEKFKDNMIQRKLKSEMNVNSEKRLANFRRRVQYGPIFVCSCCHQKLFLHQVEMFSDKLRDTINEVDPEIIRDCIEEEIQVDLGRDSSDNELRFVYLCKACVRFLRKGKFPKMCIKNGLYVDDIDDEGLKLTELENNLIARNIIFQKIHKLPKSRWHGTHDRLINVPVGPQDVLNTVKSLPRTPAEAGLIPIVPVNLKRKLEYKNSHLAQLIDTNKIFKYLKFLSEMGHPSYKFYDDWNTYEERCKAEDPVGAKLVFPDEEAEILDLDDYQSKLEELQDNPFCPEKKGDESGCFDIELEANEKAENDEEEYVKKDVIRKFQYDYGGTTCMTNKFPESDSNSTLSFAPAEGKIPSNILKDEDWDINSFPNLHPTGQNKMFQDRRIKLTPQEYLAQRLKNKDTRFQQCTPYVFAATGYVEEKQMERNIGISYNKAKINTAKDGFKTCTLDDDAFAVLDNVKGTPRYWGKAKMEMLAKIDNFGPFHWFYTLSCADMRWDENFTTILIEKGYKVLWIQKKDETKVEEFHVKIELKKEGKIELYTLEEFLEKECDESLHEFIRTNVFTATRNFVNRVTAFRTEIMLGNNNPMKITYWSDKMEFQGRGAGHIHGVAWCDLQKINEMIEVERKVGIILSNDIEDQDKEDSDKDETPLENAYRSLRENIPLKSAEERALIDFVDRSVTCTTNPEMAAKMINVTKTKEDGLKIISIVKACQTHHHTKSCKKRGCTSTCRFRFPKFPIWKTMLTKGQVDDDDEEARKERIERQRNLLDSVMNVLEDADIIDDIMKDYDKNDESIEEYRKNRKERILKILEIANVEPDDYVTALRECSRKGINVILARDIDELYVNNYNPEWLEAWNGNIDTSPVFDFFAVVTYVTEYFTKDESGTSMLLAQASKQIKNLPRRDQLKEMKNKFLTHRQMGISEAFMKILPEMRLKNSNMKTLFLHLGKREEIQRFLSRGDPELDYHDKDLIEIEDREGLYYEKPNMLDKYLRRDLTEWEELCLPQYAKMYDPATIKETDTDDEDDTDDEEKTNVKQTENQVGDTSDISKFEKDQIKYGKEVKFHYLITKTGEIGKALPNLMKVHNACPGEPNGMRKRRHPKALRFYKVKRDLNPARFFLHELMMYKSFGPDDYERWHDDEKCVEDYNKYKDIIKKVKEKVMEWIEDVEEARYFVEEAMENNVDIDVDETGENIDPEKHQDDIDCEFEGIEEDQHYRHLDTDGLKECNSLSTGNWYRKLTMLDYKELEERTCRLDEWQRKVLDNALKFVKGVKKFSAGYGSPPKPESMVVMGGAGAGKSTVIECVAQWCHRLLTKGGDDPNSPYVLKTATTGAAAALIEGSTLHSTLGFSFESKYTSLSDKKREDMREKLKNLKILIVDEFSMMKSDMLYLIHLRLCEIKQIDQDFGGVKLILFGDLAQLKPVLGCYTFARPSNAEYRLYFGDGTDTLWRRFKVINLEKNHRQGKDKEYADLLNRIRVGKHTEEDIDVLNGRARKKGHPDLRNALFITSMVKPATEYNEKKINTLQGKLYVSKATHMQTLSKKFKPRIQESGRIGDTMFVDVLKLKVGARVMVIHNIDVSDLLSNGSLGTVLGIDETQSGHVNAVIVKFDNPLVGKEARKRNPMMASKYPDGVVIKKMEKEYSLPKNAGPISSTARCIQLPIVLAWAVTVHKFQGQTVKSPEKVVIDAKGISKSDPAQAYVMLSRVQELEQLYVLEKFPKDVIRVSSAAMEEIERLISVSMNKNPTEWERQDEDRRIKVCFLNCRSIVDKFHNIKSDRSLLKSNLLILTETWLEDKNKEEEYQLPNFTANFCSKGRGKGLASYSYNGGFQHIMNVNQDGFSITKLENETLDIIGIYRSQNGNVVNIVKELEAMIEIEKPTVIGGDLNLCAVTEGHNYVTASLKELGFQQIVTKPTHIDGRSIDHIYIRNVENTRYKWTLEYFPKYYSDHDGLGLTLWESGDTTEK